MKKRQRKKLYMGLFIVFLMVTSTIGFIYSSGSGEEYNGREFVLTDSGWVMYVGNIGQYWTFNYLPEEVDFDSEIGVLSSRVEIVLEDTTRYYDLVRKFAAVGIVSERAEREDINCTAADTTLVFDSSEYNKIYKEDNCVYLEGDTSPLVDRLFYHIFGVM
jgi:hypothetical protein